MTPPAHRTLVLTAVAGGAGAFGVAAAATASSSLAVVAGALSIATGILGYLHGASGPTARDKPVVAPPASLDDLAVDLPVIDGESGLYAAAFLDATLDGRVATARRVLRPLSVVLFEIDRMPDEKGDGPVIDPQMIAATLRATLRESDLACRPGPDTYAMILEDTAEDGAVWTAERVRRNLAMADSPRLFRAGVASYPNHGMEAGELRERAERALVLARDWRRDRIEVADPV